MSKELSKTELVRLSWLTELRRQGNRQCHGHKSVNGSVCALQLLSEISGVPLGAHIDTYNHVGASAGLTEAQTDEVWRRNDGVPVSLSAPDHDRYEMHTFSEIADVVEGWFKAP